MKKGRFILLGLLVVVVLFLMAGCPGWKRDLTVAGVHFDRARVEPSGEVIGELAVDTLVGGRPCRRGWMHLHRNGIPAGFTAAADIALPRFTIPAGTWVMQSAEGIVTACAFPRDTEVQGHVCHGTGSSKGVQAAFYASGALRQFFPPEPVRIDGILCASGIVTGWVELHGNGRLKSCRLGEPIARDGLRFDKGRRVHFDPDGRLTGD